MTKRKTVAAVALVACLGVLPVVQRVAAPSAQWAWALDMDRNEALAFGVASWVMCGAIANPGGGACLAAGML